MSHKNHLGEQRGDVPVKSNLKKQLVRLIVAGSFVLVGVSHFTDPETFLAIMPPYLSWHLELVYISGFFEILGGAGLLIPKLRRTAAWGLLALLVAVFPANIYMLTDEVYLPGMDGEPWMLWARLPFQLVFALGVAWAGGLIPGAGATRDESSEGSPQD